MATLLTNTIRTDRGLYTTSFHTVATEASVSHLFEITSISGEDITSLKGSCYIDYIQLSCGSSGSAHIRDGSSGGSIVGSLAAVSGAANSQDWDFNKDPLVCITSVDTSSTIVVDMTVAGPYQGFVKYHFGPKPK